MSLSGQEKTVFALESGERVGVTALGTEDRTLCRSEPPRWGNTRS